MPTDELIGWMAYLTIDEQRQQERLVDAFTVALTGVITQLLRKD